MNQVRSSHMRSSRAYFSNPVIEWKTCRILNRKNSSDKIVRGQEVLCGSRQSQIHGDEKDSKTVQNKKLRNRAEAQTAKIDSTWGSD